jgi:hypothetical protein
MTDACCGKAGEKRKRDMIMLSRVSLNPLPFMRTLQNTIENLENSKHKQIKTNKLLLLFFVVIFSCQVFTEALNWTAYR